MLVDEPEEAEEEEEEVPMFSPSAAGDAIRMLIALPADRALAPVPALRPAVDAEPADASAALSVTVWFLLRRWRVCSTVRRELVVDFAL